MKLYITDSEKLSIFTLPSEQKDSFVIDYKAPGKIDEHIVIYLKNNSWIISSNSNLQLYEDVMLVDEVELKDGTELILNFGDIFEKINLYCYDTPFNYYDFAIGNKTTISVGKEGAMDIVYENKYFSSPQFNIYSYNNLWYVQDNGYQETQVYVNGYRYQKKVLKIGDVIFSCGLKIIWMGLFVRINNPKNSVKTVLQQNNEFSSSQIENVYTELKENEKKVVLYNDNQVFFHTPQLKKIFVPKEIKIASVPAKKAADRLPAIFTLGATIIMAFSSSISGVLVLFKVFSGEATLISSLVELVTLGTMLIGSLLLPIMQDKYVKMKEKRAEKKRQKKYRQYLENKNNEIIETLAEERNILIANNLNVVDLANEIAKLSTIVWSKEISDEEFLTVRLGIGERKSRLNILAPIEEFSLDDDNLKDELKKIAERPLTLNDVPLTISFAQNRISSFIIDKNYQEKTNFINAVMFQLVALHSANDLKIVVLTNEQNAKNWDYIKYLQHLYSDDREIRFFATTDEEIKVVTTYLDKVYQERNPDTSEDDTITEEKGKNDDTYKKFDQYYLIVTDDYLSIKRYGIINKILESEKNYGFSLVTIEQTMQNVPSKCNKFININELGGSIISKNIQIGDKKIFKPEYVTFDIVPYINLIANIPITSKALATNLPKSLTFLEMYKVGNIEQLNILNRWKDNDPTTSLRTPIGINESGTMFDLDLHEKFHGPHGLIAGSTGSGKSEFIITFILSMALNYHPYEVQFIIIDYKGGGLAGAFENRDTGVRIPHLAGTITNLDVSEMNRTLVSINSELKRRQRMFNEARDKLGESTVDIYKYQKFYREGKVKEPISHLFIISDEFAELKAQQPDFMDELVSAARIGRSLGVHLILATQKPAGVVDDQIWSNSKFKICLKVQSIEDSNEMLKKPDAAFIKQAGRFYLQVGYDELYELGQSGWTGARYIPSNKITKSIDDSINIIDNNANIIDNISDDVEENKAREEANDLGDQLTNIVKELYNIAIKEKIEFKKLWLDNVPKVIIQNDIVKKYNIKSTSCILDPVIGEYDNPKKQSQGPVSLALSTRGNTSISGTTGSGKTTLLSTMIYSIIINNSPQQVNLYIIDFGAEKLKIFSKAPQVGEVLVQDDKKKINYLFSMIENEIIRRTKYFAENEGSFDKCLENGKIPFPTILIVINSFEIFQEQYENLSTEILPKLLRDCTKYGIVFVVSTTSTFIGYGMDDKFSQKIALHLNDPGDYSLFSNSNTGKVIPASNPGRGLINLDDTYEFQTALAFNDEEYVGNMNYIMSKLSEIFKNKAPLISSVPKKVLLDNYLIQVEDLSSLPIGINIETAGIVTYNYDKRVNIIVSETLNSSIKYVNSLIKEFEHINNAKTMVLNTNKDLDIKHNDYTKCYTENFKKLIEAISQNIDKCNKERTNTKYCIVIIGYNNLQSHLVKLKENDDTVETLNDIILKNNSDCFNFIIVESYNAFNTLKNSDVYDSLEDEEIIWVGRGIENQSIFYLREEVKSKKDYAYVLNEEKCITFKYVQ